MSGEIQSFLSLMIIERVVFLILLDYCNALYVAVRVAASLLTELIDIHDVILIHTQGRKAGICVKLALVHMKQSRVRLLVRQTFMNI